MSQNTVYLVTGANRGIGHALTSHLLLRPNTTVIATSRTPFPTPYPSTAASSKFLPLLLDDANPAIASTTLASRLASEHGLTHIDVVVANAGASSGFRDVLDLQDVEGELVFDFVANAVGPVKLFRGVWPLLKSGEGKRFVLVSSVMGSIGGLGEEMLPGLAYGMSKAAANFFARKVGLQYKGEGLVVGVLHPGWVKTTMGQAVADEVNMKEPPMTVEESAARIVERIDALTPETSAKFLSYDGKELPW
ncbi:NAD(P)-binding Rossmann-fold containing protein [Podospora conica]|nr:NAD(P)-binding Rossmann-fold containing protein [Schizothecium conicum]